MRKIITVLLAVVLLNGVTELHQFLKLPLLLSHLRHHRAEDPSISLLEFLRIHYNSNQHPDDQDDREDSELPFKSANTIQHTDIPLSFRKESGLSVPSFPVSLAIAYQPDADPCSRSYSIFHPPRASRTTHDRIGS